MRRVTERVATLTAALLSICLSTAGWAAADSSARADSCAIAAGRDASNNTLICGLTPEQLRQLTKAAVEGATGPLMSQLVEVSKRLGVTEDAAKAVLRSVGRDPNVPDEKLAEALREAADLYKQSQMQVAALNPENPASRDLVAQAKAKLDAGRLEQAQQLLGQAAQAQLGAAREARKLRERAQMAEDTQMLGAARATAAEAKVALTERQYTQAAELLKQATEYLPVNQPELHFDYLTLRAMALERQGSERDDKAAFHQAIEILESVSREQQRERVPLDWARAQNNLGNALWALGKREGNPAWLLEAVAAYQAALQEWTVEREPRWRAVTQNNLGNALRDLGELEGSTARLTDAVAAFQAALQELTRKQAPRDWAMAQNNLGLALRTLGERESGTARLEEAVAAHRAALEEWTREQAPRELAMTEWNLGLALRALGEHESGTARLEEAVTAFDACLIGLAPLSPPGWVNQVYELKAETLFEINWRLAIARVRRQ